MPDPSQLWPSAVLGSQGTGVRTYADDQGEYQTIPNTTTPPYGEPDLYPETEQLPYPVDPRWNPEQVDEMLHEQMHGTPWRGYFIAGWVNPSNPGVPNLGPVNDQPFYSGHSQITVPNPSAEQGWGLDPAILLARFPHSEGINPYYSMGRHRRNGQLEWSSAGLPFGNVTQGHLQRRTAGVSRGRSTVHGRLVDNPQGVPYSSTIVPVPGNAGPLNLIPAADEGIY